MTEPKTRTIAGHDFQLSQPYAEGHTINAEEARALNQVRAENIGNNVRKKVAELLEAGNIAEAEALVSKVDAEYVFNAPRVGTGVKLSPLERECRKLARQAITAQLAAEGRKVKDVDPDKLEAAIDTYSQAEEIVAEAKKILKSREKIAAGNLADLGL